MRSGFADDHLQMLQPLSQLQHDSSYASSVSERVSDRLIEEFKKMSEINMRKWKTTEESLRIEN